MTVSTYTYSGKALIFLGNFFFLTVAYRQCELISSYFTLQRNNHDNFKGQSEAVSNARQLETERDFCHWYCPWRLLGTDDRYILLGHKGNRLLHSKRHEIPPSLQILLLLLLYDVKNYLFNSFLLLLI